MSVSPAERYKIWRWLGCSRVTILREERLTEVTFLMCVNAGVGARFDAIEVSTFDDHVERPTASDEHSVA